ncbi:MarR family transcriptional regulator [Chloroflexus sp.]|uniref:MarR family winged helix-turn-helix transcriptional regulator n=1 Tax=Chloroflexus sp. TaxID=1904827 RepID=UPI002ACE3C37|nr:MarR family transcriptional regulator [Chloroflexus sp.]
MKQHDVRSHLPHQLIHDVYVLLDDGDRRALAHTNLTPLEFNLLLQLDLEQGQRLTDVGAKLLCVKSTITRLVDRLERDGLVRRNPDPDDRRAQRLILTPRGAAVRAEALAMHNAAVERRMNLLDTEEQEQLTRLLLKLRDGLAADLAAQQAVEAET